MGRFQERVASLLCRYNCCHYPATIGVISTLRDENVSLAGRYFPQVETLPWELGDSGLQEIEKYRSPCSSFLRCKLSGEFTSGCFVSSFLFAGRLPYEPRTDCSEDFRRIFSTQSGDGISQRFCCHQIFQPVLELFTRNQRLVKSGKSAGLPFQSEESIARCLWITEKYSYWKN